MTGSSSIPGSLPGSFSGGFPAPAFIKTTGDGSLPGNLPGSFSNRTTAAEVSGVGWEVMVRSFQFGLLSLVPTFKSMNFLRELNGEGAGEVVISRQDPIFTQLNYIGGSPDDLQDLENLWEFYYNGKLIFQFIGDTVKETEADSGTEEQVVTISGPGTARVLKWGSTYSPGFPNVVYKLNALTDIFTSAALNTTIWNLTDQSLITAGTVGVDVTTAAAKIYGRQLTGAVLAPAISAAVYDARSSSISAQIVTLGQPTGTTNLVQNSSFILGNQNWSSGSSFFQNPGATLNAYSLDSFDADGASLQVITDGSHTLEGAQQTITGLLPHTSYTITAWVRAISGPATPVLQVRDLTNSITAPNSSFVLARSNAWTQVGTTITTGSSANVSLLVSLNSSSISTGASSFLLDDVACYQGTKNTFTEMTISQNTAPNLNSASIILNWGTSFTAHVMSDGVSTDVSMGYYDPALHANWRIREEKGILYFDTSPDTSIWTTRATITHSWTVSTVQVAFSAWWTGSLSGLSPAEFSNINGGAGGTLDNQYLDTSNVGGVFLDLLTQTQARGTISYVTPTFTATADSAGMPWTDSTSLDIGKGATIQDQLLSSVAPVSADWVMQPNFYLDVGLPGSIGTDKSSSIVFYESAHIDTKERLRIRDSIANYIVAADSNGNLQLVTDSASIAKWGQREGYVEIATASNTATLQALGNAALRQFKDELEQRTLKVLPESPGRTAFVDYDIGDWIGIQSTDLSALLSTRVIGISINIDSDDFVQCELTLNTRIQLLVEQMNNLVQKLANPIVSPVANAIPVSAPITSSTKITASSTSASYSQVVGDGTTTIFNIVHNLNKQFVNYKVWNNSAPYAELASSNYSATADTPNQLTITFTVAPTSTQYTVVVS